jgi:GTP-binding protein EngB required for normal cell division
MKRNFRRRSFNMQEIPNPVVNPAAAGMRNIGKSGMISSLTGINPLRRCREGFHMADNSGPLVDCVGLS